MHETYTAALGTEKNILSCVQSVWNLGRITTIWPLFIGIQMRKEKAIHVAEDGLCKARGRMDELREFVAERAQGAGDRDKYMELQFAQTTDRLSLESIRLSRKCAPMQSGNHSSRKSLGC